MIYLRLGMLFRLIDIFMKYSVPGNDMGSRPFMALPPYQFTLQSADRALLAFTMCGEGIVRVKRAPRTPDAD